MLTETGELKVTDIRSDSIKLIVSTRDDRLAGKHVKLRFEIRIKLNAGDLVRFGAIRLLNKAWSRV